METEQIVLNFNELPSGIIPEEVISNFSSPHPMILNPEKYEINNNNLVITLQKMPCSLEIVFNTYKNKELPFACAVYIYKNF